MFAAHHVSLCLSVLPRIVHHPLSSSLLPHLLKVLDDEHAGVHVAVDAVLHARVLVALERARRHAAGDALLEADGVELVNSCGDVLADVSRQDSYTCAPII